MLTSVRRLSLGFFLIAAASAVLLLQDPARGKSLRRIVILQHASTAVLEESVGGMIDGLAEQGFVSGQTIELTRLNAEGDLGQAHTMAHAIIEGGYDLVLTSSTPSMQVVAKANRDGRLIHVFGLVTDPYADGIGLDRNDPYKHPPHLVGMPATAPVIDSFRMAQSCYPGLRRVGVVWNPSESNSRHFTGQAREACRELDLTLLESPVDNSAGVAEATEAVIGRGAQAIWVGGDNAVQAALDALLRSARRAGIPVFTISPARPGRGTLFDIGLDFHEVGRLTGELAAKILRGEDTAKMPIRNVYDLVPHRLIVDRRILAALKEPWQTPNDLLRQATIVVDEQGVHKSEAPTATKR